MLQQFGTPQEIYNRPVNVWVAGFVGEPPMNIIDATVGERDGRLVLEHPGFVAAFTDAQQALLRERLRQADVRMGIRPDQIAIAPDQAEGVPATVTVTEPLGGDTLVDIDLAGTRLLVKTKPDFEGAMGSPCRIAFDVTRWHIFEKPSGVACF